MIYLIWGPPGSGKSSVANLLKDRLGIEKYIDLDQYIVDNQGLSISEIFEQKGEAVFRQIEAQMLDQLLIKHQETSTDLVIALGGGTLCFETAKAIIKPYQDQEQLMIFTLQCEVALLIQRLIGDQSRPLLQGQIESQRQKIIDLMDRRADDYQSIGIAVDVHQTVEATAECLYQTLVKHHRNVLALQGYQIEIVAQKQDELIEKLAKIWITEKSRLIIVTDDHVKKLYVDSLIADCLKKGIKLDLFRFQAGEAQKTIHTLTRLYDFCIQKGIQRQDYLIAFGGGVVGDLCGFAASTLLRGIRWIQIPTTLVSQVDSSIGAKTGINHLGYKNMIGAFYPPRSVWVDVAYLSSLELDHLKSGFAEAIKHALIWDASLFDLIQTHLATYDYQLDQITQKMDAHFCYLIYRILRVKAQIVAIDPLETGLRKILNFGHSIGHAIESLHFDLGKSIEHGCAVAIGMAMMVEMSAQSYGLSIDEKEKILELFKNLRFDLDWQQYLQNAIPYLSKDKKTSNDQITEIFLSGIGQAKMVKLSISTFEKYM
jgi:shikimate kinase/3-dehydroquinate synthase